MHDVMRKCFYIDYQAFFHIVIFRIDTMKKEIIREEMTRNDMHFQCPTCKKLYPSLSCQKFLCKNFKYACPTCCPHPVMANCIPDLIHTLVEYDNKKVLRLIPVLLLDLYLSSFLSLKLCHWKLIFIPYVKQIKQTGSLKCHQSWSQDG